MPRGDRGISVLSTLIVFPIVLMIVLLAVQYAVLYHARGVLEAAASDGLRATQIAGRDEPVGSEVANQLIDQLGSTLFVGQKEVDVDFEQNRAEVSITATVRSVVPGWLPEITVVAEGPMEEFRLR